MVPNVASSNLVTRPIKSKNGPKGPFFNLTKSCDKILEMAEASSSRRREVYGSMSVSNSERVKGNEAKRNQSGHPLSPAPAPPINSKPHRMARFIIFIYLVLFNLVNLFH